jgi:hypothetical protein
MGKSNIYEEWTTVNPEWLPSSWAFGCFIGAENDATKISEEEALRLIDEWQQSHKQTA